MQRLIAALPHAAGRTTAVIGKNGAGKSRFLNSLCDPKRTPEISIANENALPKRGRVVDTKGVSESDLKVLGLHERRMSDVRDLTPAEASALCLGPSLSSRAVFVDMIFDWIDFPTFDRVWSHFCREGQTLIVASHCPHVIERCERIVLIESGELKLDKSLVEVLAVVQPVKYTIDSLDPDEARNLLKPYQIPVEQDGSIFRFELPCGQDIANELLVKGYGAIRSVVVQKPSVRELLQSLL